MSSRPDFVGICRGGKDLCAFRYSYRKQLHRSRLNDKQNIDSSNLKPVWIPPPGDKDQYRGKFLYYIIDYF
jgi:hypothetical protein